MRFFIFTQLKQLKKQKIILLVFAFLFFFLYFSIQKLFYQTIYGIKSNEILDNVSCQSYIQPIKNAPKEKITLRDYSIEYIRRAEIELIARVVYVERNDTLSSSFDYYSNKLYDTISPMDISVFIGSMADNWKNYMVKHEKRAMFVFGSVIAGEWENLHIIPASTSIFAGLKTIKVGDIVSLKGFLIDWNGTEEFSYFNIKTALSFNDASEEKIGGNFTRLCMQFFVTELRTNGYVFN